MESVLLKANLVNLSTGQYWLKIDEEKGMSDREGHGHKAILYKSHFPATKALQYTQLLERHSCIHRLINHIYTQRPKTHSYHCPQQKVTCFAPAVSGACSNDCWARSRDPNPLVHHSVRGILLVSS